MLSIVAGRGEVMSMMNGAFDRDALDSSRPWQNYVDDERSVRDALDDDDGRSVRDALDSSRPWRSYVDDERSVRDAVDDDDGKTTAQAP